MSSPQDQPINPFDAAKRRRGVHVSLGVHDVRAVRPEWDEGRARVFLEQYAAVIAHAMLTAGTQVIRDLLEEGNVG